MTDYAEAFRRSITVADLDAIIDALNALDDLNYNARYNTRVTICDELKMMPFVTIWWDGENDQWLLDFTNHGE